MEGIRFFFVFISFYIEKRYVQYSLEFLETDLQISIPEYKWKPVRSVIKSTITYERDAYKL